jgi:hypothetical protein
MTQQSSLGVPPGYSIAYSMGTVGTQESTQTVPSGSQEPCEIRARLREVAVVRRDKYVLARVRDRPAHERAPCLIPERSGCTRRLRVCLFVCFIGIKINPMERLGVRCHDFATKSLCPSELLPTACACLRARAVPDDPSATRHKHDDGLQPLPLGLFLRPSRPRR